MARCYMHSTVWSGGDVKANGHSSSIHDYIKRLNVNMQVSENKWWRPHIILVLVWCGFIPMIWRYPNDGTKIHLYQLVGFLEEYWIGNLTSMHRKKKNTNYKLVKNENTSWNNEWHEQNKNTQKCTRCIVNLVLMLWRRSLDTSSRKWISSTNANDMWTNMCLKMERSEASETISIGSWYIGCNSDFDSDEIRSTPISSTNGPFVYRLRTQPFHGC